jgi:hypothetical protein
MSANIDSRQSNLRRPVTVRPYFMTPKPISPSRKHSMSGSKRTFSLAFEDDKEEEHYGQKIDDKFFETNIGHSVSQEAADSVIADFRSDFANVLLRRERDCESKYDVDELIEWCDFYSKNRNLFNV